MRTGLHYELIRRPDTGRLLALEAGLELWRSSAFAGQTSSDVCGRGNWSATDPKIGDVTPAQSGNTSFVNTYIRDVPGFQTAFV